MKLKDYTCSYEVANAIRKGLFSYQTVLNLSSRLKSKNDPSHEIFLNGCKEYTRMKKDAINVFLKEWANEKGL